MTELEQVMAKYRFESADELTWRRGLDRLERREGGGWTLLRGYGELGRAFDLRGLDRLLAVFYEGRGR